MCALRRTEEFYPMKMFTLPITAWRITRLAIIVILFGGTHLKQVFAQCSTSSTPFSDCSSLYTAIDGFDFANVTTNNAGCGNLSGGYTLYTTPVRNVLKGQTYAFTITIAGLFSQDAGIWIDFNGNNQFDNTEAVFLSTGPQYIHTGNITIPTGAITGTVRMRIRTDGFYAFGSSDACISVYYGETEDYNLNIVPPAAIDMSASSLVSPASLGCGGSATNVTVQVTNYGTNTINFATNPTTVTCSVSGPNAQVFTPIILSTGTLATNGTQNVTFSTTYNMSANGVYVFNAKALVTGDGNSFNDSIPPASRTISRQTTLPDTVRFSAVPNPTYQVVQMSGSGNWTVLSGSMSNPALAPVFGTGMAMFESFTFPNGTNSRLITPCFDFSSVCNPVLEFYFSQDNLGSSFFDSLAVKVSTNGGSTWSPSIVSARRYNSTYSVPGWRQFIVPLTAYAGQSGVRVGFEGYSDFGYNMGIDAVIMRVDTMARLSGSQTICQGNAATLTVNLTGTAPFSLTYTDGTTAATVTGITNSPYLLAITPANVNTYTYSISSVSNTCGNGLFRGTGVVTVLPTPSTTFSGSQTICSGTSATLTVPLTGTSPWTFTYSNGTSNTTLTGITSNPYLLSVTPTGSTTYSPVSITSNGCTQTVLTGTSIVRNFPAPSATISGNQTICSGSSGFLNFTLNGRAPWNITYTDGTTPVTRTGITSSPLTVSITPGTSRTYTLSAMNDNCSTGPTAGFAQVVVIGPPSATLSGTQAICTGQTAQLSVSLSGLSPWNLTWTNGTTPVSVFATTQNPYIINVTPSIQTTYGISAVSNLCGAGTPLGTAQVTVNARPVVTLSGPAFNCSSTPVNLTVTLTGAPNWDLNYSDGFTPASVTGITSSPYVITVTPVANNTYRISSANDVNCQATSLGASLNVLLNNPPDATLSGSQSICGGSSATLTVSLNSGLTPWDFDWSDGTTTTTVTGLFVNSYSISVSPSSSTTYTLANVSNSCGAGNTNASFADVQVVPPDNATISGNASVCLGSPANLTVTFSGVDAYDFTYTNGTTSTTLTGITGTPPYTFSVTPTGITTYSLVSGTNTITGCPIVVNGSAIINTGTPPTAALSGVNSICAGSPISLSIRFTGGGPYDVNLADGGPLFSFTGLTGPDTIITVTPLTSTTYSLNTLTNAQCGAGTVNTPVAVNVVALPTASLSGNNTISICNGGRTALSFSFTGTSPWRLTYLSGATPVTVNNIVTSPYIFNVTPVFNPTVYSIVNVNDAQCSGGTGSGTLTVNLSPIPNVLLSGPNVVCAGSAAQLTATFAGSAPFSITYTDGTNTQINAGIPSSPYVFTEFPIAQTTYTITNISGNGCNRSGLNVRSVVAVNALPTASFQAVPNGSNQVQCFNQSSNASVLTWNFGDGSPPVSGSPVSHIYASNGNYVITLIASNGCGNDTLQVNYTISTVHQDAPIIPDWIQVFPNPSTGKFTVKLTQDAEEMVLTDLRGKVIFKENLIGIHELPVSLDPTLAKGIYILTVRDTENKEYPIKINLE